MGFLDVLALPRDVYVMNPRQRALRVCTLEIVGVVDFKIRSDSGRR